MSKKIEILGEISPASVRDLKDALASVDENEPLEVEITSEGGDVFSGIQISNMLQRHKGKVTTHGVGLVASIATVILMAGDDVTVDENAFCMIHNPWTMAIGNANDLQKEIDTLEKCKAAMMGYYRKHAKVDEETIERYLDAETWFLGTELAEVFDVRVIESDEVLDIAAKFDLTKFKNIPRGLMTMNRTEQADDTQKEEEVVVEEKADETTAETIVEEPEEKEEEQNETKDDTVPEEEVETSEDEPTIDDLKSRIAELEAQLADANARIAEYEKKCEEADGDEDN